MDLTHQNTLVTNFYFCISQQQADGMTHFYIIFKACLKVPSVTFPSSLCVHSSLFAPKDHIRLPSQQYFKRQLAGWTVHHGKCVHNTQPTKIKHFIYIMIYAGILFHFQATTLIAAHLWKIAVQDNTRRGRCISSTCVQLNVILRHEVEYRYTSDISCPLVFICTQKSFQADILIRFLLQKKYWSVCNSVRKENRLKTDININYILPDRKRWSCYHVIYTRVYNNLARETHKQGPGATEC